MRSPDCMRTSPVLLVVFIACPIHALAQTKESFTSSAKRSTIAGNVTVAGRPAAAVKMVLTISDGSCAGPRNVRVVARTPTGSKRNSIAR